VIARIAPMLGLFPDTQHEDEVQASLAIPMEPARGSGERTGTGSPLEIQEPEPAATVALPLTPSHPPTHRDLLALRHEAALRVRIPGNDETALTR
jgi:cell division protein FtsI (penicillin-binding protein 3)